MTDYVAKAQEIARRMHHGQVDKSNVDYIQHPERVAASLSQYGPEFEAAGWLHDVLEDTPMTAQDLLDDGIPAAVVDAVLLVTRNDGETYRDFIERTVSSGNIIALRLKLADLKDNMRPGVPEQMKKTRYVPAIAKIEYKLQRMRLNRP